MIEIRISETLTPEDPRAAAIRRSDLDKFLDGFKKLCNSTNMHNIEIGGINTLKIPTKLKFDDGSSIGIMRLFEEIGFKDNE